MVNFEFGGKMRELIDIIGRREMKISPDEIDGRWKLDLRKALRNRRLRFLWRSISISAAACAVVAFLIWRADTITSEPDSIELYALSQRPDYGRQD